MKVKTEAELVAWAKQTFELANGPIIIKRQMTAPSFILTLFERIGSQSYCYKVQEVNHWARTDEVKSILEGPEGWKHILGFPAYQDYGRYVKFE